MDNFNLSARVVLTEMPVDVNVKVDKVSWLTKSEPEQAKMVWNALKKKYPLCMEIALMNSHTMQHVSYIEAESIVILDN